MVNFPDVVITPDVHDAIAQSKDGGGDGAISVIIAPQDGYAPSAVADLLSSAGVTENLEVSEAYVFGRLSPDSITQAAMQDAVSRIWLDHDMSVQAEPALTTIQASHHDLDAGAGESYEDITWAVLDDGIDATHPALLASNVQDQDFTGEGPVGGHGTHIAGLIGGFAPADEFYGVAPKCQMFNFKVIGRAPTSASVVIRALDAIRAVNRDAGSFVIHGANLSLGYLNEDNFKLFSPGHSPICEAANRLVASGVFVSVSAGNFGAQAYLISDKKYMPFFATATIADPGTAELPVTVGSTHKQYPNRYGVSAFSSKGPTGDGRRKPDLLAPGEKLRSCIPGGKYLDQSGTSQAAAMVSGAAAVLLHRFPDLIGQPQLVKDILLRSCRDLMRDRNFQGHGVISLSGALQLAQDRSGV